MKKYFLDKRYRKFTRRVCIFLLAIVGLCIIAYNVNDAENFLLSFFVAFALGWILAALSDE